MPKTVTGWMVKGKFVCSDCIDQREIPKAAGYIPWKEAPKEGWMVKPASECSRHGKHRRKAG